MDKWQVMLQKEQVGMRKQVVVQTRQYSCSCDPIHPLVASLSSVLGDQRRSAVVQAEEMAGSKDYVQELKKWLQSEMSGGKATANLRVLR
jgi:hypothetical protein